MIETEEKLKETSVPCLLGNIFGPVLLMAAGLMVGVYLPKRAGIIVGLGCLNLGIFWWMILGRKFYEKKRKRLFRVLKNAGFEPSHIFYCGYWTVAVDQVHGQVALLFRWNPGKVYVRPASAFSDVGVDDGARDIGGSEASYRVSFHFTVDNMGIRLSTFQSNRYFRMDSDYILTGISKADVMVEALLNAGARGC